MKVKQQTRYFQMFRKKYHCEHTGVIQQQTWNFSKERMNIQ